MKNKAPFSGKDLKAIFNDKAINIEPDLETVGVAIDTRLIEPGNIFVAIKGERVDAHNLIGEAFGKGISAAIVNKNWFNSNREEFGSHPLILSEDCREDLGNLGAYHRRRFEIPVIAIGGSNGKTTTKEMTAAVFSKIFKTLKTQGNFNNRYGVPLMLFQLDETYECAVLELATNEPGEIAILSELAAPNHGLITNIGKEHLEGFFDINGVEMEETFLFGYLLKHRNFAFINIEDERLKKYTGLMDKRLLYGTDDEANLKYSFRFDNELNAIVTISYDDLQFSYTLSVPGRANALNSVAACAVGIKFEVPINDIISALENYKPDSSHGYSRMSVEKLYELTFLNDCYNANPSSMEIALETLKDYPADKKIAVLGDMRELGESANEEHLHVLKVAVGTADIIYLFGDEMGKAANVLSNEKIQCFDSKAEIVEELKNNCNENDIILVKGSRGLKMEEIFTLLSHE